MVHSYPITENIDNNRDGEAVVVDDLEASEVIFKKAKKAAPIIMADMVLKCTKLPECSPIFDRVVAARIKEGYEI